ncbi:MAG TPA: hypothetical protein DD990_09540 [Cyanobacteria bacterium UBA11368]|nr:hypothetical protein [Cyanobacteria bacterium UBA11368]
MKYQVSIPRSRVRQILRSLYENVDYALVTCYANPLLTENSTRAEFFSAECFDSMPYVNVGERPIVRWSSADFSSAPSGKILAPKTVFISNRWGDGSILRFNQLFLVKNGSNKDAGGINVNVAQNRINCGYSMGEGGLFVLISGTPPSPLLLKTLYKAVNVSGETFQVADLNNNLITLTSAGSIAAIRFANAEGAGGAGTEDIAQLITCSEPIVLQARQATKLVLNP